MVASSCYFDRKYEDVMLPTHYDVKGFEVESAMINWLRGLGYAVQPSSSKENIKHDIDCWVKGYQFNNWVSVSIKSMATACSTGNLGFEDTLDRARNGEGWFRSGKAQYYLIVLDTKAMSERNKARYQVPDSYRPHYIMVSKLRVWCHIEYRRFYSYKGLTSPTITQQGGYDSSSYYIPIRRLISMADVSVLPTEWCYNDSNELGAVC